MTEHQKWTSFVAILAMLLARPVLTFAQQPPQFASPAGTISPLPPNSAAATSQSPEPRQEIEELRARLERLEAQVQAGSPARPAPAGPPFESAPAAPTGMIYPPSSGPRNFDSYVPPPSDAALGEDSAPIITGPTVHVGGKMLLDNVMVDQSPLNRKQLGTEDDYTGFRYLRLQFYGDLYENIDYRRRGRFGAEPDRAQLPRSRTRRFKTFGRRFTSCRRSETSVSGFLRSRSAWRKCPAKNF